MCDRENSIESGTVRDGSSVAVPHMVGWETATAILEIWRAEAVARTESSGGGHMPEGLQAQEAASAAAAAGGTWEMGLGGGAPHHRGPQRWHERLGFALRGETHWRVLRAAA